MNLRIFLVLAALPLISWSQFNGSPSTTAPLTRHYRESESLTYHMKTINQGRTGTIRYEADTKGTAKKDGAGHFIEEFQWSGLSFNGQSVPLPANNSDFRQQLSLDPEVSPSVPDFSHVNPMLIGPSADLLTFYADLWLAIKQGILVHSGDHVYVKHGTPNSWADGTRTLVGQDSIDFDITLSEVNPHDGMAKLLVRHLPPPKPQVPIPATWMEAPVADCQSTGHHPSYCQRSHRTTGSKPPKRRAGNISLRSAKRPLMLRLQ